MKMKLLGVSAELSMLENALILLIAYFVEIIHVELPDERREISVPEVDRQNLLLETVHVQDGEVRALVVPEHHV